MILTKALLLDVKIEKDKKSSWSLVKAKIKKKILFQLFFYVQIFFINLY